MKKIIAVITIGVFSLFLSGCVETESENEKGEKTRVFSISEVAKVNNTKIKINSITKLDKECDWELQGKCESYTEPNNDFFIIIDLTIENTGDEDLAISSMMSFALKDNTGEKGKYAFLTKSINSQLDGSVMPNDSLKGQIGFDIKDSEEYSFYFLDSLLDSQIKFVFSKDEIK